MSNKWLIVATFIFVAAVLLFNLKGRESKKMPGRVRYGVLATKDNLWSAPDSNTIPLNDSGELIRYGRSLISNTALYFGPSGRINHHTNGMNCQNCHLDAGTKAWAGNFGGVAAVFPRFSERRGSAETINQRIRDCFERSMNGIAPDSNSREMVAMNAYISWLGKDVPKGKRPPGSGLEQLSYIDRAADAHKGRLIYVQKCQTCHGADGYGQPDSTSGYKYPPLWGSHSYNTAAGLFRLSKFAGFVKDNMPYGSNYKNEHLTTEEAWDLAAFVNSQPRTIKKFKNDWPNVMLKPADCPDGPFADPYKPVQHKYGPFAPIVNFRKTNKS